MSIDEIDWDEDDMEEYDDNSIQEAHINAENKEIEKENQLYQILSPNKDDQGVWVHQNAWFSMGDYNQATEEDYQLNAKDNGVYIFILEGTATINGQELNKRDGFGIWDVGQINIKANQNSKILLMEVPMSI